MLRDISLHILDLTQNSVKAHAERIAIVLSADSVSGFLHIMIEDDGCGMSKAFLATVEDPFTTSRATRKVGMGIPFFKLACIQSGGNFTVESEEGKGTKLSGTMQIDNIDRLPLGNLGDTVKLLIMESPDVRFLLTLSSDGNQVMIDTDEIKAQLGDVPIVEREILEWIEEFVNENVENIFGGVLNEIIRRA